MRELLPLLFVALLPGANESIPVKQQPDSTAQRQVHWEPIGLFDGRLPGCTRIRWTRGSMCAITDQSSYWLDGGCVASAMSFEDDKDAAILADATSWGKRCGELRIAKDGTVHVMADLGEGWLPRPIPDELRVAMQRNRGDWRYPPLSIAGHGDTVAFFANEWIYRFKGTSWTRTALDLADNASASLSTDSVTCAVLDGQELLLGADDFFGGSLFVANIEDGRTWVESDDFPPGPHNVTDIAKGPDGNIYVTCKSSWSETGGRLLVREKEVWRELLNSPVTHKQFVCAFTPPSDPAPQSKPLAAVSVPAPGQIPSVLPSTNFQALAFDEEGRPCVLCPALGILRLERDGTWQCITPGWSESGANAQDFVIKGRTAILASDSAGVVLLDLDTLEGRRVRPR